MVDRILPRPGVAGGCVTGGHGYGGPGGWRACACERRIPAHRDTEPDPVGGPGCAMVWRVCADCAHVEEHHLTDHDRADHGHAGREPADRGRGADAVATALGGPGWPPVVTVCGSMRFAELMGQVAARETADGAIVLTPFVVVAVHEQDGPLKAMLDELHRRKIDLSDRVVVVSDATGYIGESTRAEIAYAGRVGVPVSYWRIAVAAGPNEHGPNEHGPNVAWSA